MINCAYDAIGSEEMKRFFFSDFIGVVRSIVDGAESNMRCTLEGTSSSFSVSSTHRPLPEC